MKLQNILIYIGLCVLLLPTLGPGAHAGDDRGMGQSYYAGLSCGQLWYERNKIYANRGFCFKTRQAINAFGPRCYAPYGRLTARLSKVVQKIKHFERRKGC